MKSHKLSMLLLFTWVIIILSACSFLNPSQPSEPVSPSERIQTLDKQVKEHIRSAMETVASEEFDLDIQQDNIVFVSRGELTIANSIVSDFANLTRSGPEQTATLGLVYITLPPEAGIKQVTGTRATLPRKFYAIQIRSLSSEAHLINKFNQSGAIVQLQQADTLPSSQPQIEVTGCKAVLRYVQQQKSLGQSTIRADVPIDWCQQGF